MKKTLVLFLLPSLHAHSHLCLLTGSICTLLLMLLYFNLARRGLSQVLNCVQMCFMWPEETFLKVTDDSSHHLNRWDSWNNIIKCFKQLNWAFHSCLLHIHRWWTTPLLSRLRCGLTQTVDWWTVREIRRKQETLTYYILIKQDHLYTSDSSIRFFVLP